MPVWEALYTITLASKTGWTEDYIHHQLPLSRGYAYYHAVRVLEGERCRWPGRTSALADHLTTAFAWIKQKLKSTRGH